MNPVKFSDPTGAIAGYVWVCGECKRACPSEQQAVTCCDRRCEVCDIPVDDWWTLCPSCREKADVKYRQERYDRAEKIQLSDYSHDYIILEGEEDAIEVNEWLDMPVGERPQWALAVSPVGVVCCRALDVVEIDDMHGGAADDLDLGAPQRALDTWRDAQDVSWYQEDGRIVCIEDKGSY